MATKRKAETAKKERIQIAPQYNRVTVLINDFGEDPVFDDWVYASVERKLSEFLDRIKPLPKKLREKADAQWRKHENAEDRKIRQHMIDRGIESAEKRQDEKLELGRYQQAADKLVAFMEDKTTPAGLKGALEDAVIEFVNKHDGTHTGVEVARFQLAAACLKAAAAE